jgi:signal transduction histidine kinase
LFLFIIPKRPGVRKMYSNVLHENRALIRELEKRTKNHKHLLEALREVNKMIQKASNLRCKTLLNHI